MLLEQEPARVRSHLLKMKDRFRISVRIRVQGKERVAFADGVTQLTRGCEIGCADEIKCLVSRSAFVGINRSQVHAIAAPKGEIPDVISCLVRRAGVGEITEDEPVCSEAARESICA